MRIKQRKQLLEIKWEFSEEDQKRLQPSTTIFIYLCVYYSLFKQALIRVGFSPKAQNASCSSADRNKGERCLFSIRFELMQNTSRLAYFAPTVVKIDKARAVIITLNKFALSFNLFFYGLDYIFDQIAV